MKQPIPPNPFFEAFPIEQSFKSHDRWYGTDRLGVLHQLDAQPYTYNDQYVATYDTEEYRRQSDILQALRLGFVLAAHGRPVRRLLDFGYGNGAFLKFIAPQVPERFGFDLTGIPVEGCTIVQELEQLPKVDVITFWDALEHVPDLSFVRDLPCDTVVISLPWCHYRQEGQAWFDTRYKHRKPDEHLHHFDEEALQDFMGAMGWSRKVAKSNHEDLVRRSLHGRANILSMAFKRRHRGS